MNEAIESSLIDVRDEIVELLNDMDHTVYGKMEDCMEKIESLLSWKSGPVPRRGLYPIERLPRPWSCFFTEGEVPPVRWFGPIPTPQKEDKK